MFCNNCGEEIKEGADYCPYCGNKIVSNESQGSNSAKISKKTWKKDGAQIGKKKRIVIAAVIIGFIALLAAWFGVLSYKLRDYNNRGEQIRSETEQIRGETEQIQGEPTKEDSTINTLKADEINIGDYITLGRYEQDNDSSDGVEDIEWRVLDKATADSDARKCILLISKYALDLMPYNEEFEDITWANCNLRGWLNNDFYNDAFSENEKKQICEIHNDNPDASSYLESWIGKGGIDTNDKVFALSFEQAEKLFTDDNDRICYYTAYCARNKTNTMYKSVGWWLRSPGYKQKLAMWVSFLDGCLECGHVDANQVGVRPAIWIYVD